MVKPIFVWPLALCTLFNFFTNSEADEIQIPSTLACSALSKQPGKFPAFSGSIPFSVVNGSFKGERSWTGKDPGKEFFSGSLNRDKTTITMTGRGAYGDGHSSWRYEFHGALKASESTLLKGGLTSYRTGATRDCSIVFLLPSDKLAAALTPSNEPTKVSALREQEKTKKQLEETAKDLAEKQKELQAAGDTLIRERAEAQRDFERKLDQLRAAAVGSSSAQNDLLEQQKALKEQQDKLALAAKNLDDQRRALDTDHQALIQEQVKTSKDVNFVQNLLAGIILPNTEDPKSWMLRVASVPVQQQQFCRIVDQFYDTIAKVYETRNEIKKNSVFRERQQSMAALLPHGDFSNWVVQVKEVTQAPDGSAAVMLQPPCRVMLGSDACQKNGSKIQSTILPNSVTYRELEKVSAGDFVVVSGTILYVASSEDKPLPSYAVYQAGSHCSTAEGSKQEDLFVTDVNYLVHLR